MPQSFGSAAQPAGGNHFALSPELLKSFANAGAEITAPVEKAELPKLDAPEVLLEKFRKTPDGLAVQEIIERYQVEWQLWATLVKNFAEPTYHAAYLAQITAEQNFEEASARYRDHRAVMLLSESTRWEAEVAELMISRVEMLATLRLEQQVGNGFRVPAWLWLLPVQSRPFRVAWITLGMLTVAKLFGYI
ncbi:MAG: hypothetical protein EOP11_09310 [Proteobacteria bacterium]|nr:MAG: hypothetical protein EOP11_09310 [Pseudomonadota bacterium]